MRSIESDLTADVGDPTTGERILIQAIAVKATRLSLLADALLSGDEIKSDSHQLLAWANSMRHDLMALGLERRAKTLPAGGAGKLIDHFSRPFEAEQAEAAE